MDGFLVFKAIVALALVIGLMYTFSWVMKRFGIKSTIPIIGHNPRMELLELLPIDHNSKLVIFKKDNKEYFMFMGVKNEMVLESRDLPEKPKKKVKEPSEDDIYKELA